MASTSFEIIGLSPLFVGRRLDGLLMSVEFQSELQFEQSTDLLEHQSSAGIRIRGLLSLDGDDRLPAEAGQARQSLLTKPRQASRLAEHIRRQKRAYLPSRQRRSSQAAKDSNCCGRGRRV